ncbi:unnamed protein product [Clonostachys solani]|uniref:Uncharacterized protein n=1 Tax=Clonostachys solani TaxID=160281 RepID=A0A9P0EKG3_9HYPO|nr:unnamed protein product [Clonostachys solani]
MTDINSKLERENASKVWKSLIQECLPDRNRDLDYWWGLTGFHLASMVDNANYSIEKQYQALLFHYHMITPYLGPAPGLDGSTIWKSLMGIDGSSMEYSWKWNTSPEDKPEIRYVVETINERSGTATDPLNQQPGRDFMHQALKIVPTADFGWTHHFLAHLFDHDIAKFAAENNAGVPAVGTLAHAVEYSPKGLGIKSYISSRTLGSRGGRASLDFWNDAIRKLNPDNANLDILMEFIRKNSYGRHLVPFLLSTDDTDPSKARLKFYFNSPSTSFLSVRNIMTLGGVIEVPEGKLLELRSLVLTLLGLPEDYPDAENIPGKPWTPPTQEIFSQQPELKGGYIFYFDVAPGAVSTISDVKFYLPVRQYGPDDGTIAQSLVQWLGSRGRGAYSTGFLRVLESLAERRRLDQGKGLQTYVGFIFKKNGDFEITSYLGPEFYHPNRFQ